MGERIATRDEQFERMAAVVEARGAVDALTELVGYRPSAGAAAAIERAWGELSPR